MPIEKKANPLFDILSENHEPIPVGLPLGFKNLNVTTYYSQGNLNITASADDVFLIENNKKG